MRKVLTVLQVILIIICIAAGAVLAYLHFQEQDSIAMYDECRLVYRTISEDTPQESEAEEDQPADSSGIDFDALNAVNQDVIGWITIPDTNIDYLIVQGTNNSHYLNYAYNGKRNWMGSIFMDYRNKPDFSDYNTVIYGHYLSAKHTMFSQLNHYLEENFWNDHKQFVIDCEDGSRYTYTIFAVYLSGADSIAFNTDLDENSFSGFLQSACENARYDTGTEVNTDNQVVTLVCCYAKNFNKRVVVQGIRIS